MVMKKLSLKIIFPSIKNLNNVKDAYSNFIPKLMEVTDKVAPVKIKESKGILKNGLIVRFQKN